MHGCLEDPRGQGRSHKQSLRSVSGPGLCRPPQGLKWTGQAQFIRPTGVQTNAVTHQQCVQVKLAAGRGPAEQPAHAAPCHRAHHSHPRCRRPGDCLLRPPGPQRPAAAVTNKLSPKDCLPVGLPGSDMPQTACCGRAGGTRLQTLMQHSMSGQWYEGQSRHSMLKRGTRQHRLLADGRTVCYTQISNLRTCHPHC